MILVTGGARSGKSRHAEALIGDSSQVLYIATSQILDDEMAARIEHHRQGRPEHWRTVERWQHLDELIHADINPNEVVLLECVTTMVTNLLFDYGGDKDPDEWDYQAMEQAINDVPQWLKSTVEKMHDKEQFSESALENMVALSAKSQEYLTRATQRYYGKTPMQIINEIRINFAKKQLEMTNYSVTDIAFEAGYSSPSLFIKTFKKLTSFTPKSYRKKLTEFNR